MLRFLKLKLRWNFYADLREDRKEFVYMKEILLLKLGEIVLKGLNRRAFEDKLMVNVRAALKCAGEFTLQKGQSTFLVTPSDEQFDIERATEAAKKIFGIASVVPAASCDKDFDAICNTVLLYLDDALKNAKTFKCEAKRADKKFPMKSPELCRELGGFILKNYPHLKVDVHNPELTVTAEVRDFAAYVHGGRIKGAGGMPVGSNGKATLLLSGGIDSPVSGYMVAKRGVSLEAVHFFSPPYTSERAKEKVIELAKLMTQYTGPMKLYIVPFTEPQLEIYEKCPEDLLTIIMRRIMMKVTERIAKNGKSVAMVTGESIGQVASQTLESLAVTDCATMMPVIRPLIGMDKEEIIGIARKIGTFNTSVLPYEDCCTVFVPKHPKIKPILSFVEKAEEILDMEAIIEKCVNEAEIMYIEGVDSL